MASVLDTEGQRHKWKGIRAKVLKRDGGLCLNCSAKATQVDHIIPRMMGGEDTYTNLQSLCTRCHKAKTKVDAARVRNIMANLGAAAIAAADTPAVDTDPPIPAPKRTTPKRSTPTPQAGDQRGQSPKEGSVMLDSPFRDTTPGDDS